MLILYYKIRTVAYGSVTITYLLDDGVAKYNLILLALFLAKSWPLSPPCTLRKAEMSEAKHCSLNASIACMCLVASLIITALTLWR